MRTTFPTLADAPRAAWPASLRVTPPDPAVDGDVERIRCACQRMVPAVEMIDLRELPGGVVTRPILCAACFHHSQARGELLHATLATAMGMHASVVASLTTAQDEARRRGWLK